MQPALVFDGISKHFGSAVALEDLSFTLQAGEVIGLLGPNGAGKTTAMQIAVGFLRPNTGSGMLLGHRFGDARARQQLGFVPDAPVFFGGNAIAALRLAARLSGAEPSQPEMERVLDRVGLAERQRDVRRFSRGMQQRLAMAAALIHGPPVLILDEPAAALDPQGIVEIRTLLQELRAEGVAILLSSHQLSEVALISDRLLVLRKGRLVGSGSLAELLGNSDEVEVVLRDVHADPAFLGTWGVGDGGVWRVTEDRLRPLIEAAWRCRGTLVSVTPRRRDLTELFLSLTSEPATAPEARS